MAKKKVRDPESTAIPGGKCVDTGVYSQNVVSAITIPPGPAATNNDHIAKLCLFLMKYEHADDDSIRVEAFNGLLHFKQMLEARAVGNSAQAAWHGIELGRAVERLYVRVNVEPKMLAKRATDSAARKAANRRSQTGEENREIYRRAVIAEIKQQRRRREKISFAAACTYVGRKYNVCDRTVQRSVPKALRGSLSKE